jgi:hypothetical protein
MQELLMPLGLELLSRLSFSLHYLSFDGLGSIFLDMFILKNNVPPGWKTVFQSREWNVSQRSQK